jgi:hypothetical protein
VRKTLLTAATMMALASLSLAGQYSDAQLAHMAHDDVHYVLYDNGLLDDLKERIVNGETPDLETLARFRAKGAAGYHSLSGTDSTRYQFEFIQDFLSDTESLLGE